MKGDNGQHTVCLTEASRLLAADATDAAVWLRVPLAACKGCGGAAVRAVRRNLTVLMPFLGEELALGAGPREESRQTTMKRSCSEAEGVDP